jgi:hypothetical protein
VTVSLTRYDKENVLPALASCLGALPNLHTLQIPLIKDPLITHDIARAFADKSFPQIRRVLTPCRGRHILRACPNVEEVICTGGNLAKTSFLDAIAGAGAHLRVFDGLLAEEAQVKSE